MKSVKFFFIIAAAAVIAVSCAGRERVADSYAEHVTLIYRENPEKPAPKWPDPQLEHKFRAYWGNWFAGQTKHNWEMEAPYFQEMVTLEKYQTVLAKTGANTLTNVEIIDITQPTNLYCEVRCYLNFVQPNGKSVSDFRTDAWVQVRGKWHHVMKDQFLFRETN